MESCRVRSYRPSRGSLDRRPVNLSGGHITADYEDFEVFIITALLARGNVVIQRSISPFNGTEEAQHISERFREAERAEQRP